jgi:hydroxymethylpyrimidine/phosphomethylpyrimidine kinase
MLTTGRTMKTVLTIAGFDPSSGAGVTADLMVFAAHGLFGTACVTALTVQSTLGVAGTHAVDAEIVRATLDHLHEDLPPAGIKIGMLGTSEVVRVVCEYLERHREIKVVLDPVLRSSSGSALLSEEGTELMRARLLPLVNWVTPNLDELSVLTGGPVTTREEMLGAARQLGRAHQELTVLVTGGHLERPDDLLVLPDGREFWLEGERVETTATHGTGCALSSALLSRIVLRDEAMEAAALAKEYVVRGLRNAPMVGHGRGPMDHLWTVRKISAGV